MVGESSPLLIRKEGQVCPRTGDVDRDIRVEHARVPMSAVRLVVNGNDRSTY